MQYVSTRGGIEPIPFQTAVMMGLADDGGLLVPERIPDVRDRLDAWRSLDYRDLALAVMQPFVGDLTEAELRQLVDASYTTPFPEGVAPLTQLGELYILELFHGPTLAFKDVALQFLGNLFEFILARTGARLNILAATSGDTGSAAICGVRGRQGIHIFVMHPHMRVSPIQERQMTTVLDSNVHNIAVEGTFDDTQRILKECAGDLDFKRAFSLGAVNSVNWARVLAQIVYYFHAAFRVQEDRGAPAVRFAVPTGNFGDILAGYYAREMGAPIAELLLATNENDILTRFFRTGVYEPSTVSQTLSPSMDIQVASNFERYLYHRLDGDSARLRALMATFAAEGRLALPLPTGATRFDDAFHAAVATRADTLATIRQAYDDHGMVLDPHTAVGVHVARQAAPGDAPLICLATAHPAKFPDAVREATGQEDAGRHPAIDALASLPTRCAVLPATAAAIKTHMEDTLSKETAQRGKKG